MNQDIFSRVCVMCCLGTLKEPPKRVSGGLLHQMFELTTSKGHYAIKLLNPDIMQQPSALANYQQADCLETMLECHGLSIIPALYVNGKKLQQIDDQFFYLFEWYDGEALKPNQVELKHVEKIGAELAAIHRIDEKLASEIPTKLHIDWDYYLTLLAQSNEELYHLIFPYRDLLWKRQEKANMAAHQMPLRRTICHHDLDCKNVLWQQDTFRIIDLECLSYGDPLIEMYETALYWSGYDLGHIDIKLFSAFIHTYARCGGKLPLNGEMIYDASTLSLEWLAFNLQRALGRHGTSDEQKIGIAEVKQTLFKIVGYHESKEKILDCLSQIIESRDV